MILPVFNYSLTQWNVIAATWVNDSREKIIYMHYLRQNKKRINFALINYRLYEIEEEFI